MVVVHATSEPQPLLLLQHLYILAKWYIGGTQDGVVLFQTQGGGGTEVK